MTLANTEQILAELRTGRMVILIDEEDRENEGDLLLPAECADAQAINFMVTHARGLVCLTLTSAHCERLNLPLMVNPRHNQSVYGTNFTVSIEAAKGVTTGISAADRAQTIKTAVAANAQPTDLVQPGHIFPLMARPGGVLTRAGHTEAGCDLARMAGYAPAAVICEIMNEDGSMARLPELLKFGKQHGLLIGTIADLIRYRTQTENLIDKVQECPLQTPWGRFVTKVYRDHTHENMHLALLIGNPTADQAPVVYMHETLSIFDLLNSNPLSDTWNIASACQFLTAKKQSGVVLLLNCGAIKGQNLFEQINFAANSSPSSSMLKSDLYSYSIGTQILNDMGIHKAHILGEAHETHALASSKLEIATYYPKSR